MSKYLNYEWYLKIVYKPLEKYKREIIKRNKKYNTVLIFQSIKSNQHKMGIYMYGHVYLLGPLLNYNYF